jgi:hypothetical protein
VLAGWNLLRDDMARVYVSKRVYSISTRTYNVI